MTSSRCAECFCIPQECSKNISCIICNKESCCADGHAKQTTKSPLLQFFRHAKGLYAAALGIEILCISAAEIGENAGLYLFGFNPLGIATAYAIGYALAGLATFITILGRFNGEVMCGCCSLLEQNARKGFVPNLKGTMWDFATGVDRLWRLHRQPNLKTILKSSVVILVTAESACILTAETVDLLLYQYSLLLSVPLALLAGAFTVMAPEAYRKIRARS